MDKREFLDRLQAQLTGLGSEERAEALEYYEEYFADAGEENEEDVLLSLGSPEQVAEQIKAGLHKAEEGMFTESGYREKVESDNPPGMRNSVGQNAYRQREYGKVPYGQSAEGRGKQREEKKKSDKSAGMVVLLIVLGILASPVIIALAASALGVAVGILGVLFGVVVAMIAVVLVFLLVGVGLFIAGFPILFYNPFAGIVCIAGGCVTIALFLLELAALVAIFGKFFPWLIREVESFGKYLSRKWSERKKRGEEAV